MKRNRNRVCRQTLLRASAGLLAAALMVCCCAAGLAAEEEERLVRVGVSPIPGIIEIDQYGNRTGLLVDYLNEIAKYTNWTYEYVDTAAEDLNEDFMSEKFDLVGGVYYSPDYESLFGYPRYSMRSSQALLLCREDDQRIKSYELGSLDGMTIGVFEQAAEKVRRLQIFLEMNDLECTIRPYTYQDQDENGTLYAFLRSGEVDLLLGNESEANSGFRTAASFDAQPYYMVVHPGDQELLDGLNMAMEQVLDAQPNFADEHYAAGRAAVTVAPVMNQEERDYVAKKQTVTVAISQDWHPLYCLDNQADHHPGILPELLEQLEELTGLRFEIVLTDTYAQSIQKVQNGEADLVGAFLSTEQEAASLGLATTRSYVSINNILVKNKTSDYPAQGLTGCVLVGRSLPAGVRAETLLTPDSAHEALELVERGQADFVYGMAASFEQEMQRHHYSNLLPVSSVNNNTPVTLAMDRPIEPELLTILNKAIGSLTSQQRETLLERNLVSMSRSSMTPVELIYANPMVSVVVFGLLLAMLAGLVILISTSRMRGAMMRNELEKAQAKSRAKSEFLSFMSHEIRTPMNAIIGLTDLTCMDKSLPPEAAGNLRKIRISSQYLLSLINDILDMSRIESGKMQMSQEPFALSQILDGLEGMISTQAEQKGLTFQSRRKVSHDRLVGDPVRLRQVLTNLLSNAVKFTPSGGQVALQAEELSGSGGAVVLRFSVEDTGVGVAPEDQGRIFETFEQAGASISRSEGTGLGLPISRSIVEAMGGELTLESEQGHGSRFAFTVSFLPAPEGNGGSAAPRHSRSLRGLRVLLAEDNELNAEIARELLATQGIETVRAVNGQEAVELFCASESGAFDVVLMDLRMPVMDGLEAARAIRTCGRPDADVPIAAMTANSFQEDEEAAKAAGMNAFVPKPVDTEYLFKVLREIV